MSEYHTEGFVKTVSKGGEGERFTVEAASPYLFESMEKNADGSAKRKILLVSDDESSARIYAESVEFKMQSVDFASLLVIKANHMKVQLAVVVEDKTDDNAEKIAALEAVGLKVL